MIFPERRPLGNITADLLEEEILKGRWRNRLPGYRVLTSELAICQKTLNAALTILTRRGILLPSKPGKARTINPKIKETNRALSLQSRKTLLIVTPVSHHSDTLSTTSICDQIHDILENKDWKCVVRDTMELLEKPGEKLESLKQAHQNSRWVLFRPSNEVIRWALKNRLRVTCIGGYLEELKIPFIAVSLKHIFSSSINHLAKNGHRRIICLLEDVFPVTRTYIEDDFAQNNIPYSSTYNTPDLKNCTPSKLHNCLLKSFSHSPPTAIIISKEHQLTTLLSFCAENSISIPNDLSIISTEEFRNIQWAHPKVARFKFPINRFVKTAIEYIENYPDRPPSAPHFLKPNLSPNNSIKNLHQK